jgi:hypothetical protein
MISRDRWTAGHKVVAPAPIVFYRAGDDHLDWAGVLW